MEICCRVSLDTGRFLDFAGSSLKVVVGMLKVCWRLRLTHVFMLSGLCGVYRGAGGCGVLCKCLWRDLGWRGIALRAFGHIKFVKKCSTILKREFRRHVGCCGKGVADKYALIGVHQGYVTCWISCVRRTHGIACWMQQRGLHVSGSSGKFLW